MIRNSFFAAALVSIGVFACARTGAAQDITWNVNNALALGTGCSSIRGDTAFISNGNDLSILFSNFGVNMQPNDGQGVSATVNCAVRVAATLHKGFYLSNLQQTITYGVNKSANTSGRITALDSFFGAPVSSFTVNIPFGPMNRPAVTQTKNNALLMVSACGGGDLAGLFKSNLAVGVVRASVHEDLILGTEGLDIRYDITAPFLVCP